MYEDGLLTLVNLMLRVMNSRQGSNVIFSSEGMY